MKRKAAKRVVCVVLCSLLLCAPLISGYAAGLEAKIPIIHVNGIGEAIYQNPDTDSRQAVFPPSTQAILKLVGQLALPLGKLAANRDWDAFAVSLADALNVFFEGFACNPDGTSAQNIGINWSYPAIKSRYERGDTYVFTYDWRLDPYEIAEQLNDFITYVTQGVGCKQVSINAHSMGGVVTATYISVYGSDKLYSVVMDSTALPGTTVAGEAFSGKIEIDDLALTRTINQVLPANELGGFIASFLKLLLKAGVTGEIAGAGQYIIDKVLDILYRDTLTPVFATCPGIWSLVCIEEYEAAKEKLLTDTDKYAGLIDKIDKYHNNVRLKAEEILRSVTDNGGILIIISKYNLQLPPVVESWDISTDSVVEAASTSYGATFAPLGEILGFPYSQAVRDGHCHVSPDLKVDASTCLFPEYTWFVKNLPHSDVSDDFEAMSVELALSKEQPTVRTYREYPQFLTHDRATGELSATVLPEFTPGDSWFAVGAEFTVSALRLALYIKNVLGAAA